MVVRTRTEPVHVILARSFVAGDLWEPYHDVLCVVGMCWGVAVCLLSVRVAWSANSSSPAHNARDTAVMKRVPGARRAAYVNWRG